LKEYNEKMEIRISKLERENKDLSRVSGLIQESLKKKK